MTNYFKVYIETKGKKRRCAKVKTSKEVLKLLNIAQSRGYEKYSVVKRIKQSTDVPIAMGKPFLKECKIVYVDGLDVDWRVVGNRVVNYDKYKEMEEGR
jgi:hypothetical protein